jgi:hypothetical protein
MSAHEVTAAVSGTLPTGRVRELYGAAVRWDNDERFASIRDSNLAEFDAWLAQHDAEVRTATLSAVLPELQAAATTEVARVLDAHRLYVPTWPERRLGYCTCGIPFPNSAEFAAHQAGELAAVLSEAMAEAWKQGALTADPNLDPSAADEYNPYGEKESES